MKVIRTIKELKNELQASRLSGKQIGFVPTMGALHKGHISLIFKAKDQNDTVVASIFVNPTQFNNKEDLEKYPRTQEQDCKMLEEARCDFVFIPSVKEMYPDGKNEEEEKWTRVNLGMLDKVMEGAHRPGHFKGVMQVVSKLFDIVEPTHAYFGMKDFQQLAVIKEMAKQLLYKIEIVPCPTLREADGLAMSSRNMRLTSEERKTSPKISQTLFAVQKMAKTKTVDELKKFVSEEFKKEKLFRLEYFEISDAQTLLPVKNISSEKKSVACVALHLGTVRLIDNVLLNT